MHYLSLLISGLAAHAFHTPTVRTVIEVQDRLDPRGLNMADVKFIERFCPQVYWKEGMSLEDVAYQQGQQDMVNFIKTRVIGRRTDGQPTG